jgi:hypothetical protein
MMLNEKQKKALAELALTLEAQDVRVVDENYYNEAIVYLRKNKKEEAEEVVTEQNIVAITKNISKRLARQNLAKHGIIDYDILEYVVSRNGTCDHTATYRPNIEISALMSQCPIPEEA